MGAKLLRFKRKNKEHFTMEIAATALKLFSKNGIRAVSKQDIINAAREKMNLPISKDEILEQCMAEIESEIRKIVPKTHDPLLSPADQILRIYNDLFHYMLNFNLAFFNDLRKYHSMHFNYLMEVLEDSIYNEVKRLLKKGKAQGNIMFWIDVDLECFIHKTMLTQILSEFNLQTNDYTIEQIYTQIFTVRFKGIQVDISD
ncbi:hypothetical protein Oweho_0451 [Owenweeksia hongkongensis DSM 17368]|uniref:Uncharacterized protein n=2 Tax=Owenweeksia TaxID=267986 RepID=G8QZ86_OWEHD|nr:hypothetical protein Oweho_0451 [Owenweeksia hongkongensis DSM 17368]